MASTWNDLFVRDTLLDTGIVPSPGWPYSSPDLICTRQTTYQQSDFGRIFGVTKNDAPYMRDLNNTVVVGQDNFFYGRALNMGGATTGGQLYLYIVAPSLTLTPGTWIQNNLNVPQPGPPGTPPNGFATLTSAAPNQIAVTTLPFVWPSPQALTHYCAVGILSTAANPWNPANPPNFGTWQDFVQWVRNHQNWCWRNLQLVDNPSTPEFSSTAAFANTMPQPYPVMVVATAQNLPQSTLTLSCSALPGFDQSKTGSGNFSVVATSASVPPGFSGLVTTTVQTQNGAPLPPNAKITTVAYAGVQATGHPVERFDGEFNGRRLDRRLPEIRQAYAMIEGQGVLLMIGCNIVAASLAATSVTAEQSSFA